LLNRPLNKVRVQISPAPSIANIRRVTYDTTEVPGGFRAEKVLVEDRHIRELISSSIQSQGIRFVSTKLSVLKRPSLAGSQQEPPRAARRLQNLRGGIPGWAHKIKHEVDQAGRSEVLTQAMPL